MSRWYSCCFSDTSKMSSPVVPNAPKKVPEDREIVKNLGSVVRKLFEEDGDVEYVDAYAKVTGMNEDNKRVMKILKTEGLDAMFKAMTTHDDGTPMTYAESRARYG